MVATAADNTALPSRWHRSVADRRRLPLSSHRDEELDELTPKLDSHSLRSLPGAPKMLVEPTPMGSRGIPSMVGGRGAVERAGLEDQHREFIQVRAASDA